MYSNGYWTHTPHTPHTPHTMPSPYMAFPPPPPPYLKEEIPKKRFHSSKHRRHSPKKHRYVRKYEEEEEPIYTYLNPNPSQPLPYYAPAPATMDETMNASHLLFLIPCGIITYIYYTLFAKKEKGEYQKEDLFFWTILLCVFILLWFFPPKNSTFTVSIWIGLSVLTFLYCFTDMKKWLNQMFVGRGDGKYMGRMMEEEEEDEIPLTEWMMEAYEKNHDMVEREGEREGEGEENGKPVLEPTKKDVSMEDMDSEKWLKKMQSKIQSNQDEQKETMNKYEKIMQERQYEKPMGLEKKEEEKKEFVLDD